MINSREQRATAIRKVEERKIRNDAPSSVTLLTLIWSSETRRGERSQAAIKDEETKRDRDKGREGEKGQRKLGGEGEGA